MISWGLKFIRHTNERHVTRSAPHILALNNLSKELYGELAAELGDGFGLTRRGILMLCKTEKTWGEEVHLAERATALGLDVGILDRQQVQALEPDVQLDVFGATHVRNDAHPYPPALLKLLSQDRKTVVWGQN